MGTVCVCHPARISQYFGRRGAFIVPKANNSGHQARLCDLVDNSNGQWPGPNGTPIMKQLPQTRAAAAFLDACVKNDLAAKAFLRTADVSAISSGRAALEYR